VSRNEDDLERVKAHLQALSGSLPTLIDRVRALAEARGTVLPALPDAQLEQQRLAAFAGYLDHYSRGDGRTLGPIDVGDVLTEAVALARGEIEPKARVGETYLSAPLVYANPRQLGQVFVSLLINASQALPAGARDAHRVDITLDTSEARWARIVIADTGSGIADDVLPHIFEPLFSTKRGAGMGVGLAIVREIVDGLGGRITVTSEPGRGTTFTIELPAAP
jgi:signal transduction histidine kinase